MRQSVEFALGYLWDWTNKRQFSFGLSTREDYIAGVRATLKWAPDQSEGYLWAKSERRKAIRLYKYRRIITILETQVIPTVLSALAIGLGLLLWEFLLKLPAILWKLAIIIG